MLALDGRIGDPPLRIREPPSTRTSRRPASSKSARKRDGTLRHRASPPIRAPHAASSTLPDVRSRRASGGPSHWCTPGALLTGSYLDGRSPSRPTEVPVPPRQSPLARPRRGSGPVPSLIKHRFLKERTHAIPGRPPLWTHGVHACPHRRPHMSRAERAMRHSGPSLSRPGGTGHGPRAIRRQRDRRTTPARVALSAGHVVHSLERRGSSVRGRCSRPRTAPGARTADDGCSYPTRGARGAKGRWQPT